jgi:broad specificity phosphatase PhoE
LGPKKIYLIRHGETEFNKSGIVQGSGIDSSLNSRGLQQADLFFETYKGIPFEKIYTSTLKRTIQSVQRFIDKGIPHEMLEGLNEISWGKSEGIPFSPESNKMYFEILESWKKGNIKVSLDGGESPEQVKNRQDSAVKKILSGAEKLILVCMHGRAMKIMLAWLSGRPLSNMDLFEHENMSLYILQFNGKTFSIETNNNVLHLKNFNSLQQ